VAVSPHEPGLLPGDCDQVDALEVDIQAYRGALGYSVPGDHDGRLSDGTVPRNGVAESLQQQVVSAEARADTYWRQLCNKAGPPALTIRYAGETQRAFHEDTTPVPPVPGGYPTPPGLCHDLACGTDRCTPGCQVAKARQRTSMPLSSAEVEGALDSVREQVGRSRHG